MKLSVVIPTYNRASDLRATLESMRHLSTAHEWELIVVDNNSSDNTRAVALAAQKDFPVRLNYVFEAEQGRCAALNAGILASTGEIVVTTDDDVRVETDWLDRAVENLDQLNCDYISGKVLPVWSISRPAWLPNHGGRHWAVIALLDYGSEPKELGKLAPLGVNMAFRREAFSRAGLWDNRLGRKAGTLLGQEVREWGLRARAAGLKGFYAPELVIHHVIPPDRLTKRYFRRWFYWHGISRAMLYKQSPINMEAPEETNLDYSRVPHVGGVPRYMYRSCLRAFMDMTSSYMRRNTMAAFEHELWMWFFAGIVRQRLRDRKNDQQRIEPGAATVLLRDQKLQLPILKSATSESKFPSELIKADGATQGSGAK